LNYELVSVAVAALSGILATYIKMQNEIVRLKSRVHSLEKSETKVQTTLDVLVEGINEIKLLLAKKGIE
tara:strand:+ start:624 stop:830 length:207 start_codon:yes stop_codon:yes gene_type:complete